MSKGEVPRVSAKTFDLCKHILRKCASGGDSHPDRGGGGSVVLRSWLPGKDYGQRGDFRRARPDGGAPGLSRWYGREGHEPEELALGLGTRERPRSGEMGASRKRRDHRSVPRGGSPAWLHPRGSLPRPYRGREEWWRGAWLARRQAHGRLKSVLRVFK